MDTPRLVSHYCRQTLLKGATMTKPLRIYSAVWGKYLDWFEKGTVQSFKWPKNNEAIRCANVTWSILTKTEDIDRAVSIINSAGIENIEILAIPPDANPTHSYNQAMVWGFVSEITRCLDLNASVIIAPPDLIFSEGTIPSLIAYGQESNTCIHVPHMRVLDSFFNHMSERPLLSSEMVDLSFMDMHIHDSWRYGKWGSEESTSFQGGVSWHDLPDNNRRVTHLLPAPFLCNFIPSDLTYWMRQQWFGAIDHEWPSELCKQERHRVITHSDIGFLVEITAQDQRTPERFPGNVHDPIGFQAKHFHNSINKSILCTFSGSKT